MGKNCSIRQSKFHNSYYVLPLINNNDRYVIWVSYNKNKKGPKSIIAKLTVFNKYLLKVLNYTGVPAILKVLLRGNVYKMFKVV